MNPDPRPLVVLDVQHAYRSSHPHDRGAVFTRANGLRVSEVDLVLGYVAAAARQLAALGFQVGTNNPATGLFVGPYQRRQAEASAMLACAYLACHVNAGGGRYGRVGLAHPRSSRLASSLALGLARSAVAPRGYVCSTVGVKPHERGSVCIRFVECPAVLLEPFFGDNPEHLARFGTPGGLQALGEDIAVAVAEWYWSEQDRVDRGRPAV